MVDIPHFDLNAALKFATKLGGKKSKNGVVATNGHAESAPPQATSSNGQTSGQSKLRLSGFMNIASNYDRLFEEEPTNKRKRYLTVDGSRYIDKWPKNASEVCFSCETYPCDDWRRDAYFPLKTSARLHPSSSSLSSSSS
jgi:hypothetical protein